MVMSLFWDFTQQSQIGAAQRDADRARDRVEQLAAQVRQLETRTERLSLTCQALWELLRDRTDVTDLMILEKMQEVDLRDGVADGKITPRILVCRRCGRNSNSMRKECLYCGHTLPLEHLFE
jgi:hypothetical protein